MDPNANLERQLEITKELERLLDVGYERDVLLVELASELVELVNGLDGWIKGGGFLPTRWQR